MKEEREIEMILSNLKICPDVNAKRAAYERMMSRRNEILAASPKRTLSEDELWGIAAAGAAQEDSRKCPKCQSTNLYHGEGHFRCRDCSYRELKF